MACASPIRTAVTAVFALAIGALVASLTHLGIAGVGAGVVVVVAGWRPRPWAWSLADDASPRARKVAEGLAALPVIVAISLVGPWNLFEHDAGAVWQAVAIIGAIALTAVLPSREEERKDPGPILAEAPGAVRREFDGRWP